MKGRKLLKGSRWKSWCSAKWEVEVEMKVVVADLPVVGVGIGIAGTL